MRLSKIQPLPTPTPLTSRKKFTNKSIDQNVLNIIEDYYVYFVVFYIRGFRRYDVAKPKSNIRFIRES